MQTPKRILATIGLCICACFAQAESNSDGVYRGPLIDVHSHIRDLPQGAGRTQGMNIPPARAAEIERRMGNPDVPHQQLVDTMRKAGINSVVLIGLRPTTLPVERDNAGYVYAALDIPRNRQTRTLMWNEMTYKNIEDQLNNGVRAIGEVSLRHHQPPGGPENPYPPDGPQMLKVYDLAAKYGVPVMIHVEQEYTEELERALEYNRNAKIIWAHMGDAPASTVTALMKKHPNLYVDISCRNPYFPRAFPMSLQSVTDDHGKLKAEWKSMFETYSDRVLFALDLGVGDRHTQLDQLIPYYRSVLGQLPLATAEKIGFRNAQKLYRITLQ